MKRDVPTTYEEAVTCDESKNWLTTTERGIHSMKENNIWRLVESSTDCNVVGCKWIFKKKFGDEGVQYKVSHRLRRSVFTSCFAHFIKGLCSQLVSNEVFKYITYTAILIFSTAA